MTKKEPEKKYYLPGVYLSEKANDQRTASSEDHRAEVAAERKVEEEERAAHRKIQQEIHDKMRAEKKARQQTARDADEALYTALDNLDQVEAANDAKTHELAEAELKKLEDKKRKASHEVRRLEQVLRAAEDDYCKVSDQAIQQSARVEELKILAETGRPEALASVEEAWRTNEAAWQVMPSKYRKDNRDRKLKNRAKTALRR